ncbi:MAG: hypothetical protein WC876_00230 [Candidatus Thermoplasmatota archaeon]|jgi:hypothetical protein
MANSEQQETPAIRSRAIEERMDRLLGTFVRNFGFLENQLSRIVTALVIPRKHPAIPLHPRVQYVVQQLQVTAMAGLLSPLAEACELSPGQQKTMAELAKEIRDLAVYRNGLVHAPPLQGSGPQNQEFILQYPLRKRHPDEPWPSRDFDLDELEIKIHLVQAMTIRMVKLEDELCTQGTT